MFAFPAEPDTTIAFRGGDDYVYRLTLTTGPFITHALPFTISTTDRDPVEVIGWNIPPETRLPVVPYWGTVLFDQQIHEASVDPRMSCDTRPGIVFAPSMAGAARVRIVSPEIISMIGSSISEPPLAIPASATVVGWLRMPHQTDTYGLRLRKGQQIVIAAESQSLDLPTVPILRMIDPMGATAVSSEKNGPQHDPVASYTAAYDGEYRLTVSDRYGHGGDRQLYQLTVRPDQTDFELALDTHSITVNVNSTAELSVAVKRRSLADAPLGPITIDVLDLPEGVTASEVVSEAQGPTAEKVTVSIHNMQSAYSGLIRIRGTTDQPRNIVRFGQTPPLLGSRFETIWLTTLSQSLPEPVDDAAKSSGP